MDRRVNENDEWDKIIADIKKDENNIGRGQSAPISMYDISDIYPNYVKDLMKYLNKCTEAFNEEVKRQLPEGVIPLNMIDKVDFGGVKDYGKRND